MAELVGPDGKRPKAKPTTVLEQSRKAAMKITVTDVGDAVIGTPAQNVILGKGEWILMPVETWATTVAQAIDRTEKALTSTRKNRDRRN